MIELSITTKNKEELIDITRKVEDIVKDVKQGTALIFAKHSTAAIIINEIYDKGLKQDILNALSKIVPENGWQHNKIDNNATSHIKATILGPSESIIIKDGRLQLGKWQSVALVEFDGPREIKIAISMI